MITELEALSFLKEHQPMPDDDNLKITVLLMDKSGKGIETRIKQEQFHINLIMPRSWLKGGHASEDIARTAENALGEIINGGGL